MQNLIYRFNKMIVGKQVEGSGIVVRTRYLFVIDGLSILIAYCLSLLIRFESVSYAIVRLGEVWYLLILAVVIGIYINRSFGLYSRLWRYASVEEAMQIVKAASLASLILAAINLIVFPRLGLSYIRSYSVILIGWFLDLAFLGGSRLALRIGLNWLTAHQKRWVLGKLAPQNPVLIVGAGNAGSTVVRLMSENPELGYKVVGFIDDDPQKQNLHVRGLPVLGNRKDIPSLVAEYNVKEVIVAMPSASQEAVDEVCGICNEVPVPARVIPDMRDLLTGALSLDQMRQLRSVNGHEFRTPRSTDKVPVLHNLLVTGGAGFIGSNFVRHMLASYPHYRIVVFDKLTYAGNSDNLLDLKQTYGENYVFIRGDICDFDQVSETVKKYEIDAIVNFAAETHVDRSLLNPAIFLNTNILGTYQLLEAARQFGVRRYHQVSTDEVYGQVIRGSFSEEDPLETRSPYSASKAGADLLVHAYYVSFGVQATITRGSNNIGPYQYPEKAVPLFITNALEDQPLPLYGDGLYVRDYQYVLDHCRGIDFVLHQGRPGEIYNLGGNNEMTALDLATHILDRLGKPYSLIHLVRDRDGQDRRYSLNCAKIYSLGWRPQWTFEQALDETIEWYKKNEWWWRKLKSGEYREFYEIQYRDRLEKAIQLMLSE